MDEPGIRRLEGGGIEISLRDSEHNTTAVRGTEAALLKLLVVDQPELLDSLVDAALERKLRRLTQDLAADPEHFFQEHLPAYQPPLFDAQQTTSQPKKNRGRKNGSTNASQTYFWEQYRGAVNMPPRLERPYRITHLAARSTFTYVAFRKYLKLWGPPPGYANPGE